jgi:hypothetical protein
VASTRERFLELFRSRMKPGSAEGELDRFIDKLSLGEVRECLSAYFDEDKYVRERRRSAAVFFRLASHAAGSDIHYALHVGAMVRLPRSPWQLHYAELSAAERDALQKVVKRQKRRLPRHQQAFVDKFISYMTDRKVTQQKIQKFTEDLSGEDLRGCLYAYIELSAGFEKGNGDDSLLIFYGLSSVALQKGGFYFAAEYEVLIGTHPVWRLRFTSLKEPFPARLRQEIEDAKVLRAEVTAGGKTYKNVPIGKASVDVAPPAQVHDEDAPRTPFSKLQLEFIRLYRRYVDSKADEKASRKAMDAFQAFLRKHKKFDDIRRCVDAYLEDSVAHYGERQSHESLRMFFGVVWDALTKAPAYYAFKVSLWIHTPGNIWHKRYEALHALDQSQYRERLAAHIDAELKRKARLIDDAKAAYYDKHRRDPDLKALREFAVVSAPDQTSQLSSALAALEVATNAESPESFASSFDAVSAVLRAQKELLTLVVLLVQCRARSSLGTRYRHLVYLYGVGLLFALCLVKYPERYHRKGFNEEENEWLLGGEGKDNPYYADFVSRLRYLMWKGAAAKSIEAMAKGEGALQVCADVLRLRLTPPIEAAALRGAVEVAWSRKHAEVRAIRIPIQSPRIGAQEVSVGETLSRRFFVLWWDERNSTVYLETEGLDGVVFHADIGRLTEIYENHSFYDLVARNTEHLLVLIPAFFQVLSYIPSLWWGGFAELVGDIIFDYAFEYSIKALGVDPNSATLAMLGGPLLARGMRPKGIPKVKTHPKVPDAPGVPQGVRPPAGQTAAIDAPLVDAPGRPGVHAGTTSPHGKGGGDARLTGTKDSVLANPTGVDTPKGDTPARGDVPPAPGQTSKKPRDPHQQDPALASRQGIDMRGATRPDAQIGVGLHDEGAVVGRMPGDWSVDGKLQINQNGFQLHGPNRGQALVDGRIYERGFNEQVAEQMAERLSHRPVEVDAPREKGWKSPSSTRTSRLKLQMRKLFDRFKRTPDASMDIVEKVGGKKAVTEAHLFEATIDPNFASSLGRKQQQVTATAWIARNNPRQGYSADTKVRYHIVAPFEPGRGTRDALNRLMNETPNLEIFWYVVR